MQNTLSKYLPVKLQEQKGQGMVEYALIIGLVALTVFGALVLLGPALEAKYQEFVEVLNF